ncbi:cyclophilin family peptidyl-prolyl cis-trans isomerase [Devosia subaequoris]|uniref:Peptidyl-prolyl cis-trans isomerase n=1 Tax=Devosia subaequoris TaxID=395930 RepID=A0A7W6IIT3_9HYPH|nr:peptidylprolyl isomerase [Devosia subaequoris]MBB4050418.1 cyclophilin family peptidyl-prolyl cis-trans isomerase [Devosia subaequoris]MCP1208892.1 peptidylprolyl isomerase [Devosia subaequoris]
MIKLTRRHFAALALSATLVAAPAFAQSGTPHLILTLEGGAVEIELLPEIAPKHVERVVTLTQAGEYDGVVFHRVIDGFMAQTGDVANGDSTDDSYNLAMAGTGGSDLPDVEAEFNSESFQRGIVGAARSQDPNSFNSQFFITTADASFLDGQYTVFGKVVSGMEAVDALEKGPQEKNGAVANPDKIVSATIEYR